MSVLGIDLDGTLYNYHTAFVYMARNYLGVKIPDASEWSHWGWPDEYLDEFEHRWMHQDAIALGLYRYGHIMKGAIIACRKLAAQHDLVVVTHRPRAAVRDTIAWLNYVNLPFSGINILSSGQPKTAVDWDLLIDDKTENIDDALLCGRKGILFDRPWNKDYQATQRGDWSTMERQVAKAFQS